MAWSPFDRKPQDGLVAGRSRTCTACGQTIVKGTYMVPCKPVESENPKGLATYPRADGTQSVNQTYMHATCPQ